jgi:hypothetical protein
VFVHGLRGHPRGTWEATASASHGSSSDSTRKSKGLKSILRARRVGSSAIKSEETYAPSSTPASSSIFWPEDYLVQDVPEAQVWTYGYNADVIGILFKANNKNTISQHGQNLSVALDRKIRNGVGWCQHVCD